MKNQGKYNALDTAILHKIGGHPQGFTAINVRDVREESERLAALDGKDKKDAFRFVDRRLQALRKAGKIKSTTKGWIREVAKAVPAKAAADES